MRVIVIACLALALCSMLAGCGGLRKSGALHGLQPGVNYMQPMKWRLTYRYRVRDIKANVPIIIQRPSAIDPSTSAVGKGTWEAWFAEPREGEELRNLRLINTTLKPTKVSKSANGQVLYYYDLAPDGYLPKEVQFSMEWEFITFERYTYWDGMKYPEYDKSSDIYQRFTKQEAPIDFSASMVSEVKKCIPEDKNNYVKTALNCYNYILNNFTYDDMQLGYVTYTGWTALQDASRSWSNREGVCDEFATVLCSMLRCAGIPARPVAGLAHSPTTADMLKRAGFKLPDEALPKGVALVAGGHAWVEFYLPNYGWIPADPTWGQYSNTETIEPSLSLIGNVRQISFADYYYGKSDPYRIPWLKSWNIKLDPAPKTRGAKKSEPFFICSTERHSGVQEYTYGWEGVPGVGGG